MFELCSGIPLFLSNSEDDILYESMLDLYAFSDKYKKKRMAEISNIEARNLVAQMLTKDPHKRPHMAQVLAHPFLSGKKRLECWVKWPYMTFSCRIECKAT
mmetsp:Transcript_19103/g.26258  ORF Transcript_19103/g.26258 Transcript_19103/m.26258 type:complete len:101 (+) Transcript_19103:291-593(+)